jgi:hypothetical protein
MAPQRPRMPQQATRRKFWGWGLEGDGFTASETEQLGDTFAGRCGIDAVRVLDPPRVDELELLAPRLVPPASLEAAFSTEPYERVAHAYGRSFRDLVRAFRRDYAHAPDLVAFPRGEGELMSVLEWCSGVGTAAIPFGGGSSVVGGVEPDVGEADMRRRNPEPPPGPPQIQLKPGMAQELLRELAPLLAEEGIDAGNIDVPDVQTLQHALNRAMERHNMSLFTPVGRARELAAATLRLAVEAIAGGDTPLAATVLDQAQPESPDGSVPTVATCTGLALGLPGQWLTRHDTDAPGLAAITRLPAGHWTGERAATDILTLARKGRAFASLDSLIARQGGQHVLYGSALALAAAVQAWAAQTDTPVTDLARAAVR